MPKRIRRQESSADPSKEPQLTKALVSRVLSELGKIGGKKRSEKMSAEERSRLASMAAKARWKGHTPR